MTNDERRERRFLRRQEKRKNKKRNKEPLSYEDVFSISNLNNSFYSCRQNTNWKASVQSFGANLPIEVGNLHRELINETWKSSGFRYFVIKERGKQREIRSVTIGERVVQKCFCDNYLVDLLSSNLIYDNGASLQGKGTKFALLRLEKHLKNFYFTNGSNNGYIVVYDFSSYFANIDHDILYSITDKFMEDEKCKKLYHYLIDCFDEGLGLGSQVSQISAVLFPNQLDHAMKDRYGYKYYARYMDDGYVIVNNKEEAKLCQKRIIEECKKLNIIINPKKFKIHKIDRCFVWLKKRIFVTDTGKVIIRPSKNAITRERRRLKKFAKKLEQGKIPYKDIECSYMSWRGDIIKNYKCVHHIIHNMDELYNKLFIEPFIKGVKNYGY